MELEQRKKILKDNIQISVAKSNRPLGGQQCGIEQLPIILKSEELDIEISINYFKGNNKNKDYGKMIFDLIIDDLIK